MRFILHQKSPSCNLKGVCGSEGFRALLFMKHLEVFLGFRENVAVYCRHQSSLCHRDDIDESNELVKVDELL